MQVGVRGDAHGWSKQDIEHRTFNLYLPIFFSGVCAFNCENEAFSAMFFSFFEQNIYLEIGCAVYPIENCSFDVQDELCKYFCLSTFSQSLFSVSFVLFHRVTVCFYASREIQISTEVKSRRCLGHEGRHQTVPTSFLRSDCCKNRQR